MPTHTQDLLGKTQRGESMIDDVSRLSPIDPLFSLPLIVWSSGRENAALSGIW